MPVHRGEYEGAHPAFPASSAAAVRPVAQPTEVSAPPINYTAEDDAIIDAWHREAVAPMWHAVGHVLPISILAH